jgi:hypothetical protein
MTDILKKIQGQSESARKVIFWVSVIILGFLFFGLWLGIVQQRVAALNRSRLYQDLNISDLESRLKNLPKTEMPKLNDQETKELEKLLQGGSLAPTASPNSNQ